MNDFRYIPENESAGDILGWTKSDEAFCLAQFCITCCYLSCSYIVLIYTPMWDWVFKPPLKNPADANVFMIGRNLHTLNPFYLYTDETI